MYFRFGGHYLGFAENLNIIYIAKLSITVSYMYRNYSWKIAVRVILPHPPVTLHGLKPPKLTHTTPILKSLHWLIINECIEYKLHLSLTYKVLPLLNLAVSVSWSLVSWSLVSCLVELDLHLLRMMPTSLKHPHLPLQISYLKYLHFLSSFLQRQ